VIPFENKSSLTESEEYAQSLLESDWEYVIRSSPAVEEDLSEKFPELSDRISRLMSEDINSDRSDVFRPGVPDFLAFDDEDYLFVEVKSGSDGLRSTQLRWIRDFSGINFEVWFSDSSEIDRIEGEDLSAYSFGDVNSDSGRELIRENGGLRVEVPDQLVAITEMSESDRVSWRLKSKDELILDTR